jgi:AcrR family transcriptional regulator
MASVLADALSKLSKTSRSGKKTTRTRRGSEKSTFAGKRRETLQGKETQKRIIQVTEKWLIASGYHTFSMRNIANECDMSVGNLTYHFPTKESLFNTVLDRIIDFYLDGFSRTLLSKQSQKDPGVEYLMEWVLKDAAKERTTRLNRELWMLSSHYPKIRRKLSDVYDTLIGNLMDLLSQKYPHLPQQQLRTISSLIIILAEGTCILYGGRYRGTVALGEMKSAVVEILTQYIET